MDNNINRADLAKHNVDLTVKILSNLIEDDSRKGNVVFSPICIQSGLAVFHAGTVGETSQQISNALYYVSDDKVEVTEKLAALLDFHRKNNFVQIFNKLYVQTVLKKEFIELIKPFCSGAEQINVKELESAKSSINRWVEEKTNGKFTHLLADNSLNTKTQIVLLSTIIFKGDWEKKFVKAKTIESIFWNNENEAIKVQMMCQISKFRYANIEQLECSILELPYKCSTLSMLIILPNEREGLSRLLLKLVSCKSLVQLAASMNEKDIEVIIPKFKLDYSVELGQTLKKIGVEKLFSAEAQFDNFSKAKEQSSFITQVLHKTSIVVAEEECESKSNDTLVEISDNETTTKTLQFQANHPFLYLIWDKKTIIIAGSLTTVPDTTSCI